MINIIDLYIVNDIKDIGSKYADKDKGKSYFKDEKVIKGTDVEILGATYVRLAVEIIMAGNKLYSHDNNSKF